MKQFKLSSIALASLTLLITACGDSETTITELEPVVNPDTGDDHHHDHEVNAGRLVMADADQPMIHVYDLETKTLIEQVNTTYQGPSLYTSPEGRFAIATFREQNLVEFVDGGYYQQLHGDHYDLIDAAPSLSGFQLHDVKPTHFKLRDEMSALFFDGNEETGDMSSLVLMDDESIADGSVVAEHHFDTSMHGTAEMRGDFVITTHKSEENTAFMPDQLVLLHRHGDHFHQEQVFDVSCPDLHGSYQNEDHIAFACSDGLVIIEQEGELFNASKIANPEIMPAGVRIGSLRGHFEADTMIGLSRGGIYLVDLTTHSITEFDWQPEEDINYLSYGFDGFDEHALMLDNKGFLNVYNAAENFALEKRIAVFNEMDADSNEKPLLVAAKSDEQVYVIYQKEVHQIDLEEGKVVTHFELDFDASSATWVGVFEQEEHDH